MVPNDFFFRKTSNICAGIPIGPRNFQFLLDNVLFSSNGILEGFFITPRDERLRGKLCNGKKTTSKKGKTSSSCCQSCRNAEQSLSIGKVQCRKEKDGLTKGTNLWD